MTVFLLIVFILLLVGVRAVPHNNFNAGYISRENTAWIKGLFTLLVLISHFSTYIPCDSPLDEFYLLFRAKIGQLVVSPFLFLSGYGVFLSVSEKPEYVQKMPVKRIWKTAFQYHAALLLFFVYQVLQGNRYSFFRLFQAFISWKGIGNSDWYIFSVLSLYVITFLSFSLFTNRKDCALFMQCILSFTLLVFLRYTKGGEYWWYDTIFAYPAGMYYARYKTEIEKKVMGSTFSWFITLFVSVACFLVLYHYRVRIIVREALAALFPWLILLAGMKIRVKSPVLDYFGNHLFSVFILQRLPMMALKNTGLAANEFVYFILCLVFTLVLSWGFDIIIPWVWSKIMSFLPKNTN